MGKNITKVIGKGVDVTLETKVGNSSSKDGIHYCIDNIGSLNATYSMVVGERSNGKTYAALSLCIEDYYKNGNQMAYIRRMQADLNQLNSNQLFSGHVGNGFVETITNGEYNSVHYYSKRWYLQKVDEAGTITLRDSNPFCYAFALSEMEHNKGSSYQGVKNIVFDEFMSRVGYLSDEWMLFMNTVSTIVRQRNDIKIFMLANTVSWRNCPYVEEMGLRNVTKMSAGDIDLYKYGSSGLIVAVEMSDSPSKKGKPSDIYFAFNNPKLNMITGDGNKWEIGIYPHLPLRYRPMDIAFTYFIEYKSETFQCECVIFDNNMFTFIHVKSTPLKEKDGDLIYTDKLNPSLLYRTNILKPTNNVEKRVLWFFQTDRVYYQNNEVGESIREYLMFCKKSQLL